MLQMKRRKVDSPPQSSAPLHVRSYAGAYTTSNESSLSSPMPSAYESSRGVHSGALRHVAPQFVASPVYAPPSQRTTQWVRTPTSSGSTSGVSTSYDTLFKRPPPQMAQQPLMARARVIVHPTTSSNAASIAYRTPHASYPQQYQQQPHLRQQPFTQASSSPQSRQSRNTVDSPTLPGISTMLMLPKGSSNSSNTPTTMESMSGARAPLHSPMVNDQQHQVSGAKWTPEMVSISPIKANAMEPKYDGGRGAAAMYYDSRSSGQVESQMTRLPSFRSSSESQDDSDAMASATHHDDDGVASTPVGSEDGGERIANPSKNSRYLREMDRREILARIEQGEKQATLAKEYQVSRAAICNLNKHREDVMSRKDENPLAKHPKKPRPKSTKIKIRASKSKKLVSTSPRGRCGAGSGSGAGGKTHTYEVKSRAAALLLTSLRNKNTTIHEFQRSSERLLRLLIEEALSLVPIKAVEVYLSDSVKADGVGWEHPPCAVTMEPTTCRPMLGLFQAMEPEQPTGIVHMEQAAAIRSSQLPASLQYHNVFVFALSAASADAICAVIQQLQARGAVEGMISIVAVFITSEIIANVRSRYPSVKIVAAQIDPSGTQPQSQRVDQLTGNVETSESALASSCCLQFVLNRFHEVYHSTSTTAMASSMAP
ncbi:putative uracil phosphoribosyltransferase, partial [Globisporangium splendens]